MSGYSNNYPDPDDFESQGNSGGGLRKMLEQVLEENRSLRSLIEGPQRKQAVTDLLKGKGIDPALAEIIPAEVDPTEWVEKYAHLLGTKQELLEDAPANQPTVLVPVEDDPALANERAALAQIRDAAESGQPATVSTDMLERIEKTTSEEEFMKLLKESQGLTG